MTNIKTQTFAERCAALTYVLFGPASLTTVLAHQTHGSLAKAATILAFALNLATVVCASCKIVTSYRHRHHLTRPHHSDEVIKSAESPDHVERTRPAPASRRSRT